MGTIVVLLSLFALVTSQASHEASGNRRICFTRQHSRYRSLSGFCNNRIRPRDGAANSTFVLQARPLRLLREVKHLPSARLISNIVCDEARPSPNRRGMSELITFFGQLLDHTITATSTKRQRPFNIPIPRNDPVFTRKSFLPFHRTIVRGRGRNRAPINRLSSHVDAASVYGVDPVNARKLRERRGGRLSLPNNLLPRDARGLFRAGDNRVSENPNLIALHLIFAREHNTVAAEIATSFPNYNDEQIYQLARHIVAAEMQAVTYHEFIPALTGSKLIPYRRYRPEVTAAISTRFSTVAFRVGHTLLNSTVSSINARGQTRNRALHDVFFNPSAFIDDGMDALFRGMMRGHASEVDTGVTSEVRNMLITSRGSTMQIDLVAFNIQRGRDNGVPSCNGLRRSIGLRPYTSFNQISSNPTTVARLRKAYRGRIQDVDPWVCGVAEDHVRGGSLGPLFHQIVREQFTRTRDADRFYFERPGYFTSEHIRKLATVRKLVGRKRQLGSIMQMIIARNTGISKREINAQPFFV